MKSIIKVNIHSHLWSVRFLPNKLMREGDNGTCWSSKCAIDIRDDLTKTETELILTHELVHAFWVTCGRMFQEKITDEDVAEFVAWNIDEIIRIRDKILKER